MHPSWKSVLGSEFNQPYFRQLADFVEAERRNYTVFPTSGDVFNAFKVTSFDDTRVLILGQDPYPGAGQAHGLSFSVKPGTAIPASLRNIYKELEDDLGVLPRPHGHLLSWAEQGVLLLNSVLTVRAHEIGSHRGKGWETFTDAVIKKLNERETPLVFVFWGKDAQNKRIFVDESKHRVIASSHPSPMSADKGFFGSRPFTRINLALQSFGQQVIDWRLPETV